MAKTDPRIFFAAERTLLAWLRTGLTLMGLGFVIARFGLFLRLFPSQTHAEPWLQFGVSVSIGVLFVFCGAGAILLAAFQHRRYLATLSSTDLPPAYNRTFALGLSAFIGLLGLLLAVYLAVSSAKSALYLA